MRAVQKLLILILAGIAAVVATGLIAGFSMWAWIVLYWAVLTGKNLVDWIAAGECGKEKTK